MAYVKRKYIGGETMEKQLVSVLPEDLRGLMLISAIRGFGKTTLATDADFPDNIVMWDFDKNAQVIHRGKVGLYRNMLQAETEPLSRMKLFLAQVEKLPKDQYTVAVIDNIKPIEEGLRVLVLSDPAKYGRLYGRDANMVRKNAYGTAFAIAYELINDAILEPLYNKGVQLVIATSHAKPIKDVPGKYDLQGCQKWHELSVLTLILVSGDHFPVPSATVWKEAMPVIKTKAASEFSEEEIAAIQRGEMPHRETIRVLPRRLPEATFEKIRWYFHNPANFVDPTEGEETKLDEIEPFTEVLSKDQIAIQLLNLKEREEQRKELEDFIDAEKKLALQKIADVVKEMNGRSLPAIRKDVQTLIDAGELEYDGEITIGDIARMRE